MLQLLPQEQKKAGFCRLFFVWSFPFLPFLCNVHHRQIQHFQQAVVCGKHRFGPEMCIRDRVTGGSVHIRTGPGKEYDSVMIAHAGDVLHGIDAEGWNPILLDGEVRWISQKYSQAQNA